MRLVVIGSGAVGGSVGGRLAAAGYSVMLVARGAHGAAIAEHGLRVEAPDGPLVIRAPVVERIADVDWQPDDIALLATKTQDVATAVTELAAAASHTTPVACFTNGLEAERIVARWFPTHAVCVMSPASYLTPGVIQQWSAPVRGVLDVGSYPGGISPIDEALAAALRGAGFLSEPRADVLRWKRTKLLLNLANALEALCGAAGRNSELATAARCEARLVFEAAGLDLVPEPEEAARRTQIRSAPIANVARRGGSTWQSLARGARVLETDYLNGEIVLLGRLHGVPTPVNALLQRAAARAARDQIAPGTLALDDIR